MIIFTSQQETLNMENKKNITNKILKMAKREQSLRMKYLKTYNEEDFPRIKEIDKLNREEFKKIFNIFFIIIRFYIITI